MDIAKEFKFYGLYQVNRNFIVYYHEIRFRNLVIHVVVFFVCVLFWQVVAVFVSLHRTKRM